MSTNEYWKNSDNWIVRCHQFSSDVWWTWCHSKLAIEEVSFLGGFRVVLFQLLSIHDGAVGVTDLSFMLLCSCLTNSTIATRLGLCSSLEHNKPCGYPTGCIACTTEPLVSLSDYLCTRARLSGLLGDCALLNAASLYRFMIPRDHICDKLAFGKTREDIFQGKLGICPRVLWCGVWVYRHSSPPTAAYTRQWVGSALVQIMS